MVDNGHLEKRVSLLCLAPMIKKLSMKIMRMADGALIAALYLTLLGDICAKYPSNHGGGTCVYWWGLSCVGALSVFKVVRSKEKIWVKLSLMVLFGLILIMCNLFNVLIRYDTWIARGMPAWGACGFYAGAEKDN